MLFRNIRMRSGRCSYFAEVECIFWLMPPKFQVAPRHMDAPKLFYKNFFRSICRRWTSRVRSKYKILRFNSQFHYIPVRCTQIQTGMNCSSRTAWSTWASLIMRFEVQPFNVSQQELCPTTCAHFAILAQFSNLSRARIANYARIMIYDSSFSNVIHHLCMIWYIIVIFQIINGRGNQQHDE